MKAAKYIPTPIPANIIGGDRYMGRRLIDSCLKRAIEERVGMIEKLGIPIGSLWILISIHVDISIGNYSCPVHRIGKIVFIAFQFIGNVLNPSHSVAENPGP